MVNLSDIHDNDEFVAATVSISEQEANQELDSASAGHALQVYRVSANNTQSRLKFRELWEHRELLYFLVWRDLKVRYKQTLIGAAWAIIQPVVTMIVFS